MDLPSTTRNTATKAQTEPQFPPEVWEVIFNHLIVHNLLQVRLTCRNWRQIVDGSPALKAKIRVRFSEPAPMDGNYEPANLYPAPNAYFRCVRIAVPPELWWPSFAANLTSLKLKGCEVSLRTLLWMLRHAPNLKQISLNSITFEASVEDVTVDETCFRLEKMECLEFDNVHHTNLNEILAIFGDIFTRLKCLKLPAKLPTEEAISGVVSLVRSKQPSLEELQLRSDIASLISRISQLDQLHLQRFSFQGRANVPDMMKLLRSQPTLKDVDIRFNRLSIEDLEEVGRFLPNLRCLMIDTHGGGTVVPSFFSAMPGLEEFEYCAIRSQVVDFQEIKSPNLKKMILLGPHIQPMSFRRYLQNSPNIQTISLRFCECPCWADLFGALGQLKNLQHLRLEAVIVDSDEEHFSICFNSLRTLTLDQCDLPKQALIDLLQQCANVEELKLRFTEEIDDEVFLLLCQRMSRLRKLEIFRCPEISDISAGYIISHCHALELLTVEVLRGIGWECFSRDSIKQIQSERAVTVGFLMHDKVVGYW